MQKILKIIVVIAMILGNTASASNSQTKPDKLLTPLSEMAMHVIPQSHIDLAWWWRYDPETIHTVVKHTLETAFDNLEKYPNYTFTFLQVPAIEPLEKLYPDLFYKLRYYVHNTQGLGARIRNPDASGPNGRLAIGSAIWCEVDGCLPCGESLVRQCLYGKRFFKYHFGIDVKTAWFQDAWTHPWTLPQILKKSGIDSYMFSRPRGKGEQMFWWQAPDGSRVFAYKPLRHDGENLPPQPEVDNYLLVLNQKYGVKDGLTLVGVGNHGGGAIRADVERMKRMMDATTTQDATQEKPAQLTFSTPFRFVEAVLTEPHRFPTIEYELEPTIRGAYTTVGEIKKGNRQCENLLMTLEKFSAIASALGSHDYSQATIFAAWQKVMINQFHDTISGTDIPPSIDDALQRYLEVQEIGKEVLQNSLKSICSRIGTKGAGVPVIVFNPLSWQRTDVVETEIVLTQPAPFKIVDDQGTEVPAQVTGKKKRGKESQIKFLFLAKKVPSLGYKTFWVKSNQNPTPNSTHLKAGSCVLENEFFKVEIDSITGCLRRVFDKQHNHEVLAASELGNVIQILEDFGDSEGFLTSPDGEGECNFWPGRSWDVDVDPQIEFKESGPVRAMVQIKHKFELARFTQRISLYPQIRRIDFDLAIDWHGKNKMIKVSFPLSINSPEATYEIPYGTICRPSVGEEQVAQKWVDISKPDYGVSLLNDSRYGHDITDNTIRLSVLRSPDHPVNATDERGVHTLRYALYPHPGDWQQADVMQQGYEFNNPLIAVVDGSHEGDLPPTHSFLQIEPKNLIATVLKKAEDSNDLILRFFETKGQSCTGKVILSKYFAVDAVHKTDLLENGIEDLKTDGQSFEVKVGKNSIESVKLIKDDF